jgi:hypothetical protein
VAIFAVADEAGFERRLDAGDHAFVDVGLALFASGGFDVDVDQFLTVDDGYAQLFCCVALNNMRFIFITPRPWAICAVRFLRSGAASYRDMRENRSDCGGYAHPVRPRGRPQLGA